MAIQCDWTTCDRPAAAVWYRTDADRKATKAPKAGQGKMVNLMPEFKVCEYHKVPWRPWVALDAPRPEEPKPAKRRKKLCRHCGREA